MEIQQFKKRLQNHVESLLEGQTHLFVADIDPHRLWETYLNSFPVGTNDIFRERRMRDCSCCRRFIQTFGHVVAIDNHQVVSIWDFQTEDEVYQPVLTVLSELVRSASIRDVLVTPESSFGVDRNYEQLSSGSVLTWDHLYVDLPERFVMRSSRSQAALMGEFRDTRQVFKRSLEEISRDALDTVLDLIAQNSLYKGEEWQAVLTQFMSFHQTYQSLSSNIEKDLYCWHQSVQVGAAIGRLKNHSIGVLLQDITAGVELDEAVRRYEAIVAPNNYKRPQAVFSQAMVTQAQQTIANLGFMDSLPRRFATIEDITVNNILFANRDTLKQMTGDVFAELKQEVNVKAKQFSRLEEVTIRNFIENILPRVSNIEVFLENRHLPNLVSVIAPQNRTSPTLFKWNNPFSWAYSGNITDSMKQRVKEAGGNVEGVLRFSLQWNENADNQNDFDAHCIEPNGNHIYYGNKGTYHASTGILDVDILHPNPNQVAVENITWLAIDKMQEGIYEFYIHNYTHRGGRSGFSAELEYEGEIFSYEYAQELRHKDQVVVAKFHFSKSGGIKFIESLPSSTSSKIVWGLQTNQFHPVSVSMFSPNYWDLQDGIGNRHYFFILKRCLNDTLPNGFFNEFLQEELMPHKRVFEALGGKMRVESSEEQLSGLGFSSTQRNSLICKVSGNITRTLKITF